MNKVLSKLSAEIVINHILTSYPKDEAIKLLEMIENAEQTKLEELLKNILKRIPNNKNAK